MYKCLFKLFSDNPCTNRYGFVKNLRNHLINDHQLQPSTADDYLRIWGVYFPVEFADKLEELEKKIKILEAELRAERANKVPAPEPDVTKETWRVADRGESIFSDNDAAVPVCYSPTSRLDPANLGMNADRIWNQRRALIKHAPDMFRLLKEMVNIRGVELPQLANLKFIKFKGTQLIEEIERDISNSAKPGWTGWIESKEDK